MFRSNIEHFSFGAENSHSYNGAASAFFIGQNVSLLTFWLHSWRRRDWFSSRVASQQFVWSDVGKNEAQGLSCPEHPPCA